MFQDNPAAALEALKKAQAIPLNDPILAQLGLTKATFSQGVSPTSGLTFYDLEAKTK
ncbi:hypothetical protein [Methylobacterium terricola]|uniref:hypothetical protein n=1 Tax=Methylobacterium terricola TaxID=2583531 RepID=UPI0014875615|nr:hypothetical protein [Methylobacterium terricola]